VELCRGDGGGGALRGLICGAMPDHGLAGVSMRGGSDGYVASAVRQSRMARKHYLSKTAGDNPWRRR
jgi:hypothetical protein